MEHTLISMPDTHASILQLIHQLSQDILCSTPGAKRAVAPADPFDNDMLDKAMASAAELERKVPGSQRILLKAYSGVAVLRYMPGQADSPSTIVVKLFICLGWLTAARQKWSASALTSASARACTDLLEKFVRPLLEWAQACTG